MPVSIIIALVAGLLATFIMKANGASWGKSILTGIGVGAGVGMLAHAGGVDEPSTSDVPPTTRRQQAQVSVPKGTVNPTPERTSSTSPIVDPGSHPSIDLSKPDAPNSGGGDGSNPNKSASTFISPSISKMLQENGPIINKVLDTSANLGKLYIEGDVKKNAIQEGAKFADKHSGLIMVVAVVAGLYFLSNRS